MNEDMSPARYIREHIFGVQTQAEFAELLDYSQANISRIETGAQRPGAEYQERVRSAARRKGLRWDNNWFFEVPRRRRVA